MVKDLAVARVVDKLVYKTVDAENGDTRAPRDRIVRIPKGYEHRFVRLRELKAESVDELVSVLENEPPTLDPYGLGEKIAPEISTLTPDDVAEIVRTVIPLYALRGRTGVPIPDFVEDILRAMDETDAEELKLSGQDREDFRDRMIQLFSVESIDVGLKAEELLLDHEHTIHSARVLTDIRPVFGIDPEDSAKAAVIVHMLKISYHDESKEVKEFYVALDTGDISRLMGVLERADAKAESLIESLEDTSMDYIHAD